MPSLWLHVPYTVGDQSECDVEACSIALKNNVLHDRPEVDKHINSRAELTLPIKDDSEQKIVLISSFYAIRMRVLQKMLRKQPKTTGQC
jgi:hypothetical protein